MQSPFPYSLYLVVSRRACGSRSFLELTEQALRGGVDMVQLREKECPVDEFISLATALKKVTDKFNVPLIINDNLTVMEAVGAAGIHVGNSDTSPVAIRAKYGDKYMIGYSVEHLNQTNNEKAAASDCIAASPVFNTSTKTNTIIEWGLEGIRQIRQLTTKPLIAIGNMNAGNAADVIRAGADCIAVVSAICQAIDPEQAAFQLKEIIKNEKEV